MRIQGFNERAIARSLNRSNSSVNREFARNSREDGTYSANYADKKYAEHRKNARARISEVKFPILFRFISVTALASDIAKKELHRPITAKSLLHIRSLPQERV